MRGAPQKINGEVMCAFGVDRKEERPNDPFVDRASIHVGK
jgi:hypothetical protein